MQSNTSSTNNFEIIFQKLEEAKDSQGQEMLNEIKVSNDVAETISLFQSFQEEQGEHYFNFTRS